MTCSYAVSQTRQERCINRVETGFSSSEVGFFTRAVCHTFPQPAFSLPFRLQGLAREIASQFIHLSSATANSDGGVTLLS
jgi:hypothetical protein